MRGIKDLVNKNYNLDLAIQNKLNDSATFLDSENIKYSVVSFHGKDASKIIETVLLLNKNLERKNFRIILPIKNINKEEWTQINANSFLLLNSGIEKSSLENLSLSKAKISNLSNLIGTFQSETKDLISLFQTNNKYQIKSILDYVFEMFGLIRQHMEQKHVQDYLHDKFSFTLDPLIFDLMDNHIDEIRKRFSTSNDVLLTLQFTLENLFYEKGFDEIYFIINNRIYYGDSIFELAKTISNFFFNLNFEKAIEFKEQLITEYNKNFKLNELYSFYLESLITYFDIENLYWQLRSFDPLVLKKSDYFERILKKLTKSQLIIWS